ncbi:MAG: N-acetylneuraminate synthase family protein, partial [Actinomycetota bacterium]|nr:N-acetylneuraminate synthase family protein [Actinomycetota bacterium]
MLVERDLSRYTVANDETVEEALRQIARNGRRTVFCIEQSGALAGVITDGDFRRWLLANPGGPLSTHALDVANTSYVSARSGSSHADIEGLFSEAIQLVPIVDDRGRLVSVARPRTRTLWIAGHEIGERSRTFVVAEIGINHNGSVAVAKELVDVAASAGADCAKFQMRDLASLYRNEGAPGDFREDLGPQYTLDLLGRFSLGVDEMIDVLDYTRRQGLVPLCTPWDLESARVLDEYGIPAYKVASADLTNHALVSFLAETGRPVIVSTGMSTEQEIVETVGVLRSAGAAYALLHCNSTYPAPFKDVNLRYMDRLGQIGDCAVGYSGHERGYHVALAAVARGARIVEKHVTLDRSWEGSDHKVSLEPDELVSMVREIREIEEALGSSVTRSVTPGEMMNRVNLAKSLVARVAIRAGTEITDDLVDVRSPGRGLQPNRRSDLVGRTATRDMEPGDFFFEGDLARASVAPRRYRFRRPWGLPVRYHDYRELAACSNPDFLEFHMSYRDLDLRVGDVVSEPVDSGLVVHSPDLFPGDHILNLASADDSYWKRSISELQRVVDRARELAAWFRAATPVLVVASLGGFSADRPLPGSEIAGLYARVAAALEEVDEEGVEVIAQTLPPYPWYLGGQRYCNLFVGPEDTAEFAARYGRRICLDVAHTKLACTER